MSPPAGGKGSGVRSVNCTTTAAPTPALQDQPATAGDTAGSCSVGDPSGALLTAPPPPRPARAIQAARVPSAGRLAPHAAGRLTLQQFSAHGNEQQRKPTVAAPRRQHESLPSHGAINDGAFGAQQGQGRCLPAPSRPWMSRKCSRSRSGRPSATRATAAAKRGQGLLPTVCSRCSRRYAGGMLCFPRAIRPPTCITRCKHQPGH